MDERLTNGTARKQPELIPMNIKSAGTNSAIISSLIELSWVPLGADQPDTLKTLSDLPNCLLLRPSMLAALLHSLVASLKDSHFERKGQHLTLLCKTYESPNELKRTVHNILSSQSYGDSIKGSDEELLLSIFKHHPKASDKLKNYAGITIGFHIEEKRQTRCFFIKNTENEQSEISYTKSIQNLVKSTYEDQEKVFQSKLNASADTVINTIHYILRINPLLLSELKKSISKNFPYRTIDLQAQKFYLRNLLSLSTKFPELLDFIFKLIIERLIDLESEGDVEKLDSLLVLLLNHVTKYFDERMISVLLDSFEELILPTENLGYVQVIYLYACSVSKEDFLEKFISRLFEKLFSNFYAETTCGYLASCLGMYGDHILEPSTVYLADFIIVSLKKKRNRNQAFTALSYLLHMIACRPELLASEAINNKVSAILCCRLKPLEKVKLHPGTDYSALCKLQGFSGDNQLGSLLQPMRVNFEALKQSALFFGRFKIEEVRRKRRRGYSLDLECSPPLKKRAQSMDETHPRDESDCASSYDTADS